MVRLRKLSSLVLLACSISAPSWGQSMIRLNQLGFDPGQEKVAIWDNEKAADFTILDQDQNIVLSGEATRPTVSAISQKKRYALDFSKLNIPGTYTLKIGEQQAVFEIGEHRLNTLSKAAIRAFYYQRSGMPIEEQYAGIWHREGGHPDTTVWIHPNATSDKKALDTPISSPAGWYDAGDYNKYIVNSAYSIGLMLNGYQLAPQYYQGLSLNIPESTNSTPDLLDEIYYNLKWMLTMQDPMDGGVYHKLTTPNFEGFIKPEECRQPRYVVYKSVTAALDFAAVMAQSSRLYAPFKEDYPRYCQDALAAAIKAYAWAKANPTALYHQNELNKTYKPAIVTGEYGDQHISDEFFWAATELYLATQRIEYLDDMVAYCPDVFMKPGWAVVSALGTFSYLLNAPSLLLDAAKPQQAEMLYEKIKKQLLVYAEQEIGKFDNSSFYAPYGNDPRDFGWGCIAEGCGNQAISLLFASKLCDRATAEVYVCNAFRNMDYMLGRNATGYCYVTGFGTKSPLFPHHRLSASDGIDAPIPGFLVGGPNPAQQDKYSGAKYSSNYADESYSDMELSFASNEIAINWNAALVVLSGVLDAWGK